MPDGVTKISGAKPGPVLAIFAGLHGNEKAGIMALEELAPSLKISIGTLYLVIANPPAIKANTRFVDKNLNRCFMKGNSGKSYEDNRAKELMILLDKCDALLDLHMFYDDSALPFVICEDNALDIAKKFDVPIISTNWTAVEPGAADGYMFQNGKVGICIECGPISKALQYKDFAKKTLMQFLRYYGMVATAVEYSLASKRIVRAEKVVYKNSDGFRLAKGFHNFDSLGEGQLIATDKHKVYLAEAGQCIIFPHYQAQIGEEAYIVGEEIGT